MAGAGWLAVTFTVLLVLVYNLGVTVGRVQREREVERWHAQQRHPSSQGWQR